MAYVSNAKAVEIAHELASKIGQRLNGALALVEGFDSDGCPTIKIGSGTAGQKNWFIKLANMDWALAKDSLGLAAGAYGPEVVMIATEANYAGATDNVADVLGVADLLPVLAECIRTGCQVQWFQSATGVAPTSATITGAPAASFWPSLKYSMLQAQ